MSLNLPPMPSRIAKLPRDHRGYPVPYFVAWVDGKPDHRIADQAKMARAMRFGLCNVCGETLGRFKCFVIGPMCAVNRLSAEPPVHLECGEWSARACPFLSIPAKKRRDNSLPDEVVEPAGNMIRRNPGAVLLWVTRRYQIIRDRRGYLFRIGDPEETRWVMEGREATRQEVLASFESGLPLLREVADKQGLGAPEELEREYQKALTLVPT